MVLAKDQPVRVFGAGTGEVAVSLNGAAARAVAADGRWCAELPAMKAGGPYVLEVSSGTVTQRVEDVHVGTVVLAAGQSNMQLKLKESTTPKADWKGDPLLRSYTLPRVSKKPEPHSYKDGWVVCTDEDAGNWSAIGYHVGREIRARTGEAVGVVNCYQGASTIQAWLPAEIADAPQYVLPPEELFRDHFDKDYAAFNVHGILYKTTFLALAPYALSSVVWYQGESNTGPGEPKVYAQLVAELVKRWRADLRQPELPFVVVQIADTRKSEGWRGIQAAQLKVPELVPNVKTVRSGDVCEAKGIHPPTKAPLAKRIAEAL